MSDTSLAGQERSRAVARYLFEEHAAAKRFAPLPADLAPTSVEEAYAAQAELVDLNRARDGEPVGYKIGLTTPVMQRLLGIDKPAAGVILAKLAHRSPYWLVAADFVRLGIECEIAVQLGADLPAAQAPFTRRHLLGAIETVMPAIGMIEDRAAGNDQLPGQGLSLIADNLWNAGIILGGPVSNWRALDLAAVRGKLVVNGNTVGEGQGRDVMGHPLDALVWLANLLAAQGKSLAAGMVVLTGAIIPTKFVAAGSEVRFLADALGDVRVTVE